MPTTQQSRSALEEATTTTAAQAVGVTKIFGSGESSVVALNEISVTFRRHELTAIMGPSGSGKSTLLHVMSGLDTPTSGSVRIGDTDISALDDSAMTRLRRDRLGFIFQAFNLLPQLNVVENITLPLDLAGAKPDAEWIALLIETVGLQSRVEHRPAELSGGQQQRVAVARALATRPELIFADEPTGNLDSRSSNEVLQFLRKSVDDFQQSVVMVTHDAVAASFADRVLFLADGRFVDEMASPTTDEVLDHLKTMEV